MTAITCTSCGRSNDVNADKLFEAQCSNCGDKLIEETVPYEVTETELEASLNSNVQTVDPKDLDINKWIQKIGDHDKQTKYVNEGFWSKVKRHAAKVPFAKEVVTLYYCSIDPKTPIKAKVTAVGALAYWIMPLDLLPDFVPVVGFVDDATAVFIAYKALSGQITDEHRDKAEQFFILSKDIKLVDQ